MGDTKSKSNHTGNVVVTWFNDDKVSISKNRDDVMLTLQRRGDLPRQVKLYELFADTATWIKASLLELKRVSRELNPEDLTIQEELAECGKIWSSVSSQNREIRKENHILAKAKKELLDEVAVAKSTANVYRVKFELLRRVSVALSVITISALSYAILIANTEGAIKLI